MDKQIENPATRRELRSAIRFPTVGNTGSADVHRRMCEVYGENATSDSTVIEMGATSKQKLRRAIRNKRHGMLLSRGIVFVRDNARPRTQ